MASIKAALTDLLLDRKVSVEEAARRHFSDDYRQRTDGVWSDRFGFLEHIGYLRTVVASCEVRVLEELQADGRYADRHEVRIEKADGRSVVQEVHLFATLADDGRFAEVHELTHMLSGSEGDRRLGTARA